MESAHEFVTRKAAESKRKLERVSTRASMDQMAAEIRDNFHHLMMAMMNPDAVKTPDEITRFGLLSQTAILFAIGVAMEWEKFSDT